MGKTELFGALKERQFRLLWLGQATSTLGDGLVPVALSFAVIEHARPVGDALGLVLAAETLPLVAVRPRRRRLGRPPSPADGHARFRRHPRARSRPRSRSCCSAAPRELWHLAVLVAIYGTAQAFFQPAATGVVPATISAPRLQQANALLGLSRGAWPSSSGLRSPA